MLGLLNSEEVQRAGEFLMKIKALVNNVDGLL